MYSEQNKVTLSTLDIHADEGWPAAKWVIYRPTWYHSIPMCTGPSHPLLSSDSLEVKELEEVVLHKAGASQKQALDLLEVDVPDDRLHGFIIRRRRGRAG